MGRTGCTRAGENDAGRAADLDDLTAAASLLVVLLVRDVTVVSADYFRGLEERVTPAAIIPMHTPEEAITELEFVIRQLGPKVGVFGSNMARKVPAAANDPDTARFAVWHDVFGIDSDYDYDPVWAKCVQLGIAPTFHSASSSQGLRLSPTNFVYNHIDHFAAAGHATAKALFLGGVTRRFPELRFTFLEGGVGWASPIVRRSDRALGAAQHPGIGAHASRQARSRQIDEPGREVRLRRYRSRIARARRPARPEQVFLTGGIDNVDDFSACQITRKEDWVELYAKPYYFGCEADDRMNASAFGRGNPFGAKLNAIFSSDIGHFDVIDMRDPLPEAYELVEDGHITADDFRDFTFSNRCGCGARRTRNSSRAPGSLNKPQPCSPRRKPQPSPLPSDRATAAPPSGGAASCAVLPSAGSFRVAASAATRIPPRGRDTRRAPRAPAVTQRAAREACRATISSVRARHPHRPLGREQPATSAARIAASPRLRLRVRRQRPVANLIGKTRG